ncbi:hypothetical protein HOG48_03935 [Candidatus Peregrinibacteria bacterium]|nr:hypothetical protein [Candidatus Peregrinibacteria bacterium]
MKIGQAGLTPSGRDPLSHAVKEGRIPTKPIQPERSLQPEELNFKVVNKNYLAVRYAAQHGVSSGSDGEYPSWFWAIVQHNVAEIFDKICELGRKAGEILPPAEQEQYEQDFDEHYSSDKLFERMLTNSFAVIVACVRDEIQGVILVDGVTESYEKDVFKLADPDDEIGMTFVAHALYLEPKFRGGQATHFLEEVELYVARERRVLLDHPGFTDEGKEVISRAYLTALNVDPRQATCEYITRVALSRGYKDLGECPDDMVEEEPGLRGLRFFAKRFG